MITPKILQDSENINECFGVHDDRFSEMWTHMEVEFIKWSNDKAELGVDTLLERCALICQNEHELMLMSYSLGAYLVHKHNPLHRIRELFT